MPGESGCGPDVPGRRTEKSVRLLTPQPPPALKPSLPLNAAITPPALLGLATREILAAISGTRQELELSVTLRKPHTALNLLIVTQRDRSTVSARAGG